MALKDHQSQTWKGILKGLYPSFHSPRAKPENFKPADNHDFFYLVSSRLLAARSYV